ncbi:hypothetical protein [Mameliella alba]|jgi:hypothetical protein|nr:hypothetical protein [Mameliella alba]
MSAHRPVAAGLLQICVSVDFVLTLKLPQGSSIDQTSTNRIARFVD